MNKTLLLRNAIKEYRSAREILLVRISTYNAFFRNINTSFSVCKYGEQIKPLMPKVMEVLEQKLKEASALSKEEQEALHMWPSSIQMDLNSAKQHNNPACAGIMYFCDFHQKSYEFDVKAMRVELLPNIINAQRNVKEKYNQLLKLFPDFDMSYISLSAQEVIALYDEHTWDKFYYKITGMNDWVEIFNPEEYTENGEHIYSHGYPFTRHLPELERLDIERKRVSTSVYYPSLTDEQLQYCMSVFSNPNQDIDFPCHNTEYFSNQIEIYKQCKLNTSFDVKEYSNSSKLVCEIKKRTKGKKRK